ncbi:MAG: hypothetical protein C0478_17220 [Planctomyces sp.]|nr:hypothetical protein [Planctomyces sp.]
MTSDWQAALPLLKCPRCFAQLATTSSVATETSGPVEGLICANADCRLQYPIRDEIPVLVIEFARELPREEWQAASKPPSTNTP